MSERNNRSHDREQDRRIAKLETEVTKWQQTIRVLKVVFSLIGGLLAAAYTVLQLARLLGWLPGGGE